MLKTAAPQPAKHWRQISSTSAECQDLPHIRWARWQFVARLHRGECVVATKPKPLIPCE
jgi:hypothetical protein